MTELRDDYYPCGCRVGQRGGVVVSWLHCPAHPVLQFRRRMPTLQEIESVIVERQPRLMPDAQRPC